MSKCDGDVGKYWAPCPDCKKRRVIHCCPDEWHPHLDAKKECDQWACRG